MLLGSLEDTAVPDKLESQALRTAAQMRWREAWRASPRHESDAPTPCQACSSSTLSAPQFRRISAPRRPTAPLAVRETAVLQSCRTDSVAARIPYRNPLNSIEAQQQLAKDP